MPDLTAKEPASLKPVYEERPSVKNAALVSLQAGGVGVLVASVQNALDHHNRGAMGIFTRSGGTIGFFGQFRPIVLYYCIHIADVCFWLISNLLVRPWRLCSCHGCDVCFHRFVCGKPASNG